MTRFLFQAFAVAMCCTLPATAQITKGDFIKVSAGYASSIPTDDSQSVVEATGLSIQGEYVWAPATWFSLRPFAGIVIAKGTDVNTLDETLPEDSMKTNAFLVGGTARFTLPIRYFAPYVELGLGAAIGSFETRTELTNINRSGFNNVAPIGVGFVVGRKNNFDIGLKFYSISAAEQFLGIISVGYVFPLHDGDTSK